MNKSMIATYIVHTIWSRLAQSILRKIVCIHFNRFSNPCSAWIFKITNQLFMFRIDADRRQTILESSSLLLGNITKLTITIRMGWTCETFAIRFQAQSSFFNNRITVTCETLWPNVSIAVANLRLVRLTQRSSEDGFPAVSSSTSFLR